MKFEFIPGLILLLLLNGYRSFGQNGDDWHLAKDKDGIRVYTRYAGDSEIKEFKAVSRMEGKLSEFIAVLKDVDNYSNLFNNMEASRTLESSDTALVYYAETWLPWPFSNRDGIYSLKFRQNYQNKIVFIKIKSLPNYLPEEKGNVRIRETRGSWTLEPLDGDHVEITLEMHIDPGGSFPNWLVNMFLVDTPFKDFTRLRERVQLEQYQNRKFGFLIDY